MESLPAGLAERLDYSCHHYGDHALQRVGVWRFKDEARRSFSTSHLLVYLHGGAWRDPRIGHEAFAPAIGHLLETFPGSQDGSQQCPIRGFASIDYRLSPGDNFPQDPATTPKSELRDARHPDHIEDVRSGLRWLAAEHLLSDGYILLGHSAGATLAFQLVMGEVALNSSSNLGGQASQSPIPLPRAIIGLSGIYDLVALNKRVGGSYAGFMSSAFGDDQDEWVKASPACFPGRYRETWPGETLALLAHSPEDTLVDVVETDAMGEKLREDGVDVLVDKDLTGEHDFVWRDGSQIARLVGKVLTSLRAESA